MLALYGVTMPQFNEYITTALAGQAVSQVYEGNNTFDLTVKVADDRRNTIEKIGNLLIDGNGAKIPLSYIADIESSSGPNTVSRENVKRKIVVSANVVGGDLGGAVEAIRQAVDRDIVLPEGYYVEYGGQFESQQSASRTLVFASLLAILVVFMLLFQEFKSVPLSTMIMVNLPFALVGGVVSIWITSDVVSIPSIIGFISLFGISVRNGILLVSRYNQAPCGGVYAVRRGRTRFARPPHPHPDDLAHHGPRPHSPRGERRRLRQRDTESDGPGDTGRFGQAPPCSTASSCPSCTYWSLPEPKSGNSGEQAESY